LSGSEFQRSLEVVKIKTPLAMQRVTSLSCYSTRAVLPAVTFFAELAPEL